MANEKVAFQVLHLVPGPNAAFVGMVQKELVAALNNYVLVKKQDRLKAQANLMDQQKTAVSQIDTALKAGPKQWEREAKAKFGTAKTEAPKRQTYYGQQREVTRHQIADPVVQGFEVSYAATRTSKAEFLQRIDQVEKFHGIEGMVACKPGSTPDSVQIRVFNGDKFVPVIEAWFGAGRFIKASEAGVFKHRTNPAHEYVQDRNGFFIARYLIRNLSSFDRGKVETSPTPDPVLTARGNRVPTEETLIAEITTHVRSKEASGGDTCFISFSHTKHKIVGSTAALFYTQANGDIVIDASKIDVAARVDLHSLDSVKKLFGVSEVKPTMAFSEGDPVFEQNAAARDTVRTREILVAGSVPVAAVVAVRLSTAHAKAPWTRLDGVSATLPGGVPEAWRN